MQVPAIFRISPPLRAVLSHLDRTANRRWSTPWLRMFLPALYFAWALPQVEWMPHAQAGVWTMNLLIGYAAVIAVMVATTAGRGFANAQKQGMFGLITITALSRSDILAMMGLPALFAGWRWLLMSMPIAMLPLVLGTTTASTLVLFYAATALWIVLAIALGLVVGLTAMKPLRWQAVAIATTVALALPILAIIGWLIPALEALTTATTRHVIDFLGWFIIATPLGGMQALSSPDAATHTGLAMLVEAALILVILRQALRSFPDDHSVATPVTAAPAAAAAPATPSDMSWSRFRPIPRPGAGLAAIAWREFHGPGGGALRVYLVSGAVIGLPILLRCFMMLFDDPLRRIPDHWPVIGTIMWWSAIGLVLLIGHGLTNIISAEIRQGTCDDLRLLPYTLDAIVRAKIRGILRSARPIALAFAVTAPITAWNFLSEHDFDTNRYCWIALFPPCIVLAAWQIIALYSIAALQPRVRLIAWITAVVLGTIIGVLYGNWRERHDGVSTDLLAALWLTVLIAANLGLFQLYRWYVRRV